MTGAELEQAVRREILAAIAALEDAGLVGSDLQLVVVTRMVGTYSGNYEARECMTRYAIEEPGVLARHLAAAVREGVLTGAIGTGGWRLADRELAATVRRQPAYHLAAWLVSWLPLADRTRLIAYAETWLTGGWRLTGPVRARYLASNAAWLLASIRQPEQAQAHLACIMATVAGRCRQWRQTASGQPPSGRPAGTSHDATANQS